VKWAPAERLRATARPVEVPANDWIARDVAMSRGVAVAWATLYLCPRQRLRAT